MVRIIFFLFIVVGFSPLLAQPLGAQEGVVIIVNAENPSDAIGTDELVDFYLKKKRQWPDGNSVRFIDRTDDSPERKVFLKRIVGKTGREVDLYWIGQKLYSGDSAPMQVSSDAMTATLVSRLNGAIGYVSSQFAGAKGVKKIDLGP